MKQSRRAGLALTFLFLLLLGGCSVETAPSAADARRALCQTLSSLRESAAGLSQIDANTGVAQLRDMRDGVGRWVEAARRANSVLQFQQITEMVNAYDAFSRAVDGLNPEQRVGAAAVGLQASAAQILTALNQAYSAARCGQ